MKAMRRARLLGGLILGVAILGWHGGRGAERRPMSETDLLRFVWIADPQISPDGTRVAFVRVTVNEEKDRYETALWMVPADGSVPPSPFTSGPHDTAPRWSPDGRTIAFLRAVERDGRVEPPQIYLIPATGGEARPLATLPRGAGDPVWSPDGKRLAFTSTTTREELARVKETKAGEGGSQARRASDVRVITRAVYRYNGRGYLDPTRPNHVWIVTAPGAGEPPGEPTPLTSGEFDETNLAWTADGRRVLFLSDRVTESYYFPSDRDLYAVAVTGGEPVRIASIDGVIGAYAVSPDGRRVAFVGTPNGEHERSYDQPDLFVADLAPGAAPRNLTTGYDRDVGSGLTGDQRAPRGSLPTAPIWAADGRSVLVVASDQGRANLVRVEVASGRVTPVTEGNQEVLAYTASPTTGSVVVLISTATNIGDLFLVHPERPEEARRLTDVNAPLWREVRLSDVEEFWYPSFDGRRIQAWIQKPPDFDPGKRYPLILQIHGGPHAAYGYTFMHEFQWMAARGYVVLFTNPRGSSSYGQEFGNIIQYRYPGDDYRDLMLGVDDALKRPYIDPKRLGLTGGSGGGLLTNWVITQTDRFAAAVSQRSIADWAHFWYTADFALFTPFWFRRPPWEDPDEYRRRSPIAYVDRVKTPLMLIEGEEDYRTPPGAGGEQMFRALKYRKIPTVMVRFPGETHDLSRSGKPSHRIERLRQIGGWFDQYLLGKTTDGGEARP